MIVNKMDKTYQTRSDMPNSNWLDKDWVVIPDNSELSNKIMRLFPRFDLVLDENNNVVDVAELAKTEEELNQEKIAEIKEELEETDKVINRATEDLYALTEVTPYQTIQETIDRKNELRQELKKLIKGGC